MTAIRTHPESYAEAASLTARRLTLALLITLAFVIFEAIAGLYANSLALLTDAGHNLTDVVALGLTWYALRLAARPSQANKTFGYHRAGILIALFNSASLIAMTLWIFYEAYQRIVAPPRVQATVITVVAVVAFAVNLGTALLVKRGSHSDLNLRSAYFHLVGDVASTFGAILAGIGIQLTGWTALDPLVSILIALLILWNAWGIVRESVDILLESTPRDVDMKAMVADVLKVQGVRGIHDLHVWSITQNMRALSAHILTDDVLISAGSTVQREINDLLYHRYGIAHAALQLECTGCEPDDLYCDLVAANHSHGRDAPHSPRSPEGAERSRGLSTEKHLRIH